MPQSLQPQVNRFLSREYAGLIEIATRWLDIIGAGLAAFAASVWLGLYGRDWLLLVLVNLLLNYILFQQGELYRSWRGRPYSDQFSRLVLAWLVSSAATAVIWLVADLREAVRIEDLMVWLFVGLT
ncbi:MAG: hypothetical protein RJA77_857, partial [Pseudomonadota bacterium]